MKILKQLMSAVALSILASTVSVQAETTGNLINQNSGAWTGAINYTGSGGGTSGGSSAGYNSSTGTLYFGYTSQTASQLIGINTALQGTGIQVNGYNWSWDIYNYNSGRTDQAGTDTLTASISTLNAANQTVHTFSQTYNTRFNWTTFSGTQTYANPYLATDLSSLRVQFSGIDNGFWAGYYGPQVRNINVSLNYGVDQCTVNPQSSPTCPGYKTYYQMWDDGFARVDLPFAFPFYGNLYTTSFMYTNGVVGFLNNNWGFCCDGTDLNGQVSQPSSPWNYAIYALNTDLIPGPNSEFYTQVTDNGTGLKYSWVNVPEIGTNLNNTFHVQIKDSGYIGITYDQVNLNPWRNPLIGIAGDISQGQYSQYYFGQASSLPPLAGNTITYTGTETTDICTVNPLYNSSCPGYEQAYFNQQCSINPLYNTSCPGYQQAYYNYQCSANPLYDVNCPGYATAYYNYQCSADPLYHTGCPGYEQAYFNQQCSADPLYNNQCTGYAEAYFSQQCGLNGLYSTSCPNYADAYYVQQCNLDALYDKGCTGYAEAYAKKNILNIGSTSTTSTTESQATTVVTSSESASAPAIVSDPVVNQTVTTTATSASPAQAATATVPLVSTAPSATTTTAVAATTETKKEETKTEETKTADSSSSEEKKEEKKEETKTADSGSGSSTSSASSGTASKDQPKTTRQALAERRLEAARAKAIEDGKQLAGKMGEAASMEAQIQVQGVVVAAMSFVPGFDRYGQVTLPDVIGYKPFEIYKGQRNVDNPAGRRFLTGADAKHQEMVDLQYNRSE